MLFVGRKQSDFCHSEPEQSRGEESRQAGSKHEILRLVGLSMTSFSEDWGRMTETAPYRVPRYACFFLPSVVNALETKEAGAADLERKKVTLRADQARIFCSALC